MEDISSTTPSLLYPDSYLQYDNLNNITLTESPTLESSFFSVVLKVIYTLGILGNGIAILAVRIGERRVRNRKHLLLLTSLAANDFIAMLGMMGAMVGAERFPKVKETKLYCACRVMLRVFGIGSVCIAVTMALERYVALTRPFMYQKYVTYNLIRMTLLLSYFWVALMTSAPIFSIGLYYDEAEMVCVRYREARTAIDYSYGMFYAMFGTGLCVILVYCNLAVIRALYEISAPRNGGTLVVRRVSKSSCRQQHRLNAGSGNLSFTNNSATAEEVAFSRLMATLSVLFMICWLPQMLTTALYLALGPSWWQGRFLKVLSNVSDFLMLLNYVLDPILYVLMRQKKSITCSGMYRSIVKCFRRDGNIIEEKAHVCTPNFIKNELAEMVQKCKNSITAPNHPAVLTTYNNMVADAKDSGLDLILNIPSFSKVKTNLYRHRNSTASVKNINSTNAKDVEVPPIYAEFLLADMNTRVYVL